MFGLHGVQEGLGAVLAMEKHKMGEEMDTEFLEIWANVEEYMK